jgi:hypothetical protein
MVPMDDGGTLPTDADVEAFLAAVTPARRRRDARTVCDLMTDVTGQQPVMWGSSIVGFGRQSLRYASGRELDWMVVGFSPRKAATTLYLAGSWDEVREPLARLGPHTTGAGCLYLKDVEAVDAGALREVVQHTVDRAATAPG